ncbi:MAG: methyltransferase domain-containing protein [Deltaproteobacteria bacterium]|nr:methyltransferase domain-containing protein [Deltaproteobacteria bacterium]
MRGRALDFLVCPRCRGSLALEVTEREGDEITEGALRCGCGATYPVTRGVPRLLPDAAAVSDAAQRTVDRFGEQWNEFDFLGEHYEQQFLGWISPNTPESFRGEVVLEGGCGKGRHSALVSKFGAKDVIALDLGSAVEAAYRNTRGLPNVHVVQGDLFNLPIRPGTVDTAFSVGVLHHTPDPKRAFLELVSRVRPGGRMIAWVYGKENNEWILKVVDPLRRALTSRLPHRAVYQLSKVPAAMVFLASRGIYRPLSRRPFDAVGKRLFYQAYLNAIAEFPFAEVHSIVHDHLTPPIANYLARDEFAAWFTEAGLEHVTISWHNENSWRGTGRRRELQPAEETPHETAPSDAG